MQEELKISDEKDDIGEAEEAIENTSLLNVSDSINWLIFLCVDFVADLI